MKIPLMALLTTAAVSIGVTVGTTPPLAISAPLGGEMLIDTVASKAPNSQWTLDPRMQPQIGQSFVLDRTVSATSVVLHPSSIALAKKPEYLTMAYRNQYYRTLTGRGSINAETVLNIWKSKSDPPLPADPTPKKGGFDVASGGFDNVYTDSYSIPVDLSKPFVLPIEPALTLDPGVYLIAWYMQFPGSSVFNVRFSAEVSGKSGGGWQGDKWIPTICEYDPIPDSSPPGSTAYIADQWASPYGAVASGPYPGTIGYLTWFRAGTDKAPTDITGCVRPDFGGYDKNGRPVNKKGKPLKNPYDWKYSSMELGDLDMQLMGTVLPAGS